MSYLDKYQPFHHVPASKLGLLVEGPVAACESADAEERCFGLLFLFFLPLFGSIFAPTSGKNVYVEVFSIIKSFAIAP